MTNTSARYNKTYPVSWEQLHRDSKALAWRLAELGPFGGIVAVTRGGLVPAAVVARELDIHTIETACITSYDWKNQGKGNVLKAPDMAGDGTGWLVVDDLVDTGGTLAMLREMLPGAYFATVYAKPKGTPMVDTFIKEFSQDSWVLFPWDSQLQLVEPIVKIRSEENGDG